MLTNQEIQQKATTILEGEEFQAAIPKADDPSWLQKAFEFVLDKLKFDPPTHDVQLDGFEQLMAWVMHYSGGLIMWGTLLIVLCLVAIALYKFINSQHFLESTLVVTPEQRRQAHQSYTALAQQAFETGKFNTAIHYLFLATVSLVIEDEFFHASDTMTNREIAEATSFSAMTQRQSLQEMFNHMVAFDEPRWFGTQVATQKDYQEFAALYQAFQRQVMPYVS